MFPAKLPIISQSPAPAFANTYSIELDGTDDFVSMGDVDLIGTGDYSISIWFKSSTTGTVMMTVSKGSSPLWKMTTASDKMKFEHNSDGSGKSVTSNSTLMDGNWHHCVVTGDRDDKLRMYIDGTKQTQETVISSDTGDLDDDGYNLYVGSYSKNGAFDWNGSLDELAIWNAVLSDADAVAIYNIGNPNDLTSTDSYDADKTSNLIGYWRFEDGSGTNIADSSTNSNNGTTQNDATFSTDAP